MVVDQAMQIQGDRQCWTAQEFQRIFAGLPYHNQSLTEWASFTSMKDQVKQCSIKNGTELSNPERNEGLGRAGSEDNQFVKKPYFIERLELNDAELEAPGYLDWEKLRQDDSSYYLQNSKKRSKALAKLVSEDKVEEKADRDNASSNY